MLEVELKAWADLEAARARLEALGKRRKKHSVKEDVYFCASSADPRHVDPLRDKVVRLRIEDERAFVTAKKKELRHGAEVSEEIELEARPADAARALIAYMGFRPFLRKRKETDAFDWGSGFTVELNRIAGLGEFVEIEKLLPDGASHDAVEAARSELHSVLGALGVAPEKLEPRLYMDLLRERGVGLE